MGRAVFLALAVSLILLTEAVQAQLSCQIRAGSCATGEVNVLKLFYMTNAHAEVPIRTNYNYYVCCSGVEGLGTSCSAAVSDVVLALSDPTNAHVEKYPRSPQNYLNNVCLSLGEKGVSVDCVYQATSCPPDYSCVVSISGDTNAHVATCSGTDSYSQKVCCKAVADTTPPVTEDDADTAVHGSPYTVTLTCTDSPAGCKETKYCYYDTDTATTCTPDTAGTTVTLICPDISTCNYKIKYQSTDNVDNVESVKESALITIDTTLPSCEITVPGEYLNSTSFNLSWSGSDPRNDPIKNYTIQYRNDTVWKEWGTFTTTNGTFEASEGYYQLRCQANTDANQGSFSNPANTTVDITKPVAWIVPKEFVSDVNFTVNWTGEDFNGSGISQYTVLAGDNKTNLTDWATTGDTSKVFEGEFGKTYYFRVRALDRAGNLGDWSAVNSTRVTGAVEISPVYNETIASGEEFVVNASIVSATDISTVSLTYDSTEANMTNKTEISAKQWNVTWAMPAPEPGTRNFTITVTDIYGDSVSSTHSIIVFECLFNVTPPQRCGTAEGTCTLGWQHCSTDNTWSNCSGVQPVPEGTRCDGLDNDCDGDEDEGLNCTCTIGDERDCGNYVWTYCDPGHQVCTDEGEWGTCTGTANISAEECNGVDDDCNGEVDDRTDCCPEGQEETFGPDTDVGACEFGLKRCVNGLWETVTEPVWSAPELCDDGLDNDCDGRTDKQDTECIWFFGEDFPWHILILAGLGILAGIFVLYTHFKRKGKELTWEELRKKWAPARV